MLFNQKLCLAAAAAILLIVLLAPLAVTDAQPMDQNNRLNQYVNKQREESKIPGLAVVVVQDKEIIYEQYSGYADVESESPITSSTLFEIGSNSKAFTGLAVLHLEKQGLISREDSVSKYLPWFYMTYDDKRVDLTIAQLLHHTSAIPRETIGQIPALNSNDALERTVRTLVGQKLEHHKKHQPGEYFMYATINYDILGLIIQKVTGMSYEDYMQEHIIKSLGLESTFMHHEDAVQNGLATGYKLGFMRPRAYDAPRYRGNIPAGYVSSTPADIAKWMQIQLGSIKPGNIDPSLIQKSHVIDATVSPASDGSSYAVGWSVFQSGGGEVAHGGNNPNFSSFILMHNDGKFGVAVLANMNSDHTEALARGVMSILRGKAPVEPLPDTYSKLDKIASVILAVFGIAILILLSFILRGVIEIGKGKRRWTGWTPKRAISLIMSLFFLALYLAGLYYLPIVLFGKLPWSALQVWAPYTLMPTVVIAGAFGMLYALYHLMTQFYEAKIEKPYVPLLVLGLVSGFGNAFIIFVINQTFGRDDNLTNGLLFYFVLGIIMYVYGQRYISIRLITLTNNLVYEKRMELVKSILKTPFEKLERFEDGRLHAVLNNDTEVVSRSINVVVSGIVSLVTLICCFIYLGTLNFYALLVSMGIIVLVAGLYFLFGRKAEMLWEETRSIQTVFFRMINDMLKGYKELRLNQRKNREFEADLEGISNQYRVKRTQGDVRFANVNVVGELLFTVVIGVVAFLFPVIFPNLLSNTVQAYVFVFLYITGPVNGMLNAYPSLLQIRISWNRIKELATELTPLQKNDNRMEKPPIVNGSIELAVVNLQYNYEKKDDSLFIAGPYNLTFRSGTITFITGGNGSGKTTLAKLITGLYAPSSGIITVNNEIMDPDNLGSYFSAIFSDYYLFERLYGIDCSDKEGQISSLLCRLQLEDKVTVKEGRFSTTMLSTGQKKRLALLLTYLEDSPICLFDEWAADQDPEYRHYFYHEILPKLKAQGKCIIAITHDDHYFHLADSLIKLERGRQVVTT